MKYGTTNRLVLSFHSLEDIYKEFIRICDDYSVYIGLYGTSKSQSILIDFNSHVFLKIKNLFEFKILNSISNILSCKSGISLRDIVYEGKCQALKQEFNDAHSELEELICSGSEIDIDRLELILNIISEIILSLKGSDSAIDIRITYPKGTDSSDVVSMIEKFK